MSRRPDSGMVTAEFAVGLPAVVLVLGVGLAGLSAGVDQVRCVDAARLAARALARGDPAPEAVGLARAAAPNGAQVELRVGELVVSATVSVGRHLPGVDSGWVLSSTATAVREDWSR